ncbi:hypothetical protein HID58_087156 [Brassica napus]|uniref:RRM domain-containing protein n=1 Tax=Brassica napus TaxID=3708 RepID=A0ABQ7XSG5_BRANA|nr:hypothetical protein HID58_087156 [Brassica napus]
MSIRIDFFSPAKVNWNRYRVHSNIIFHSMRLSTPTTIPYSMHLLFLLVDESPSIKSRCSTTIRVYILRFWEARKVSRDGELMGVDMLLLDGKKRRRQFQEMMTRLASSVTETDFKKYFALFGTIIDLVVVYDHKTHRRRGFGLVTYNEEAVDLQKTFHELDGKWLSSKWLSLRKRHPAQTRILAA